MRIRFLAAPLCCLALVAGTARAQVIADQLRALMTQADQALGQETPDGAARAVGISRAVLTILGPSAGSMAARPNAFIGQGYLQLGMLDSAGVYERRALKLLASGEDKQALALVYQDLSRLHLQLGRADSAAYYAGEGVRVYRASLGQYGSPAIFIHQSNARIALNQFREARLSLRDAITEGSKSRNAVIVASAMRMLGKSYMTDAAGRSDSALYYLRLADALHEKAGLTTGRSQLLNDMASFYRQHGQPDSSLAYGRRALVMTGTTDAERVATLLGLALSHAQLNEFSVLDSALHYSEAALVLVRRVPQGKAEVTVRLAHGAILSRTQKDSAVKVLRGAIPLVGINSADEGVIRLYLGLAELKPGDANAAITDLKKANALLHRYNHSSQSQALFGLGTAFYVMNRLDSASSYFARSFDERALLRSTAGDDYVRIMTGESGIWIIDQLWTSSWFRRRDHEGEAAVLAALAVSDRARAQALTDLMTSQRKTEPVSDYAAYGRKLVTTVAQRGEGILFFRVGADSLTVWALAEGQPAVMVRSAITAQELNGAVIDYLKAIGARAGQSRMVRADIETDRGAISSNSARSQSVQALSARLASILFPEAVAQFINNHQKVVVIPHAMLGVVPFAALPLSNGEPLGKSHSLRFAPSLASLSLISPAPQSRVMRNPVVVGNPVMPVLVRGDGLQIRLLSLPGAEREAMQVAGKFKATALTGPAATESFVRSRMRGASVIHLATHGFAYSRAEDAGYSFVALAPDSVNDGMLTMREVMTSPDLDLTADLVVLSACQSGLGSLTDAEGTVGLQRAFLARGARSLLVSLWNVSDEATQQLMNSFYAHWLDDKDSPSKAEALRRAQEDVRKMPEFSDPKYWAAFQLVGAN